VHRPFFSRYDEQATRLSDLKPAIGEEQFFYQEEFEQDYRENLEAGHPEDYE